MKNAKSLSTSERKAVPKRVRPAPSGLPTFLGQDVRGTFSVFEALRRSGFIKESTEFFD